MIRTKMLWVAAAAALTAGLSACNLGKAPEPTADVNALYTMAAQTLVVESGLGETQTAAASSPTVSPTSPASFTPLPTFGVPSGLTPLATFALGTPIAGLTPLPTQSSGSGVAGMAVGCNNAVLIGEDPADGKVFSPLKQFQKSWSLQNTGTCPWDENYTFAFKSGEQMSGEDIKIVNEDQFTKPGHSQAFIVHLQAPKPKGEYKGFWQMKSDTGEWFGALVWVDIIVG